MPERWERELRKLRGVDVDEPAVRERVQRGPTPDRPSFRRDRLVAGIVAFAVFGAAGAFAWQALSPSGIQEPVFGPGSWPVATVSLGSGPEGKSATLSVEGSTQSGVFGAATSPDERYPYSWVNPTLPTLAQPLRMPMGSELELQGDVTIKELLFGDAQQLDEGAGPDSGPIWADQPDFSEPYFLPWNEVSERTYLKFFGTWADGSVLDVYFEIVFVAPDADLSDTRADIVVTPDPMGAVFVYGGQRSPMGITGGTYGNMSVVGEPAGYEKRSIVARVPAGTPLRVSGDRLVDASVRAGNLPFGEGGRPLAGAVPAEPGRYVLTLEVTWDGGSATFLHQIEVVAASAPPEPSLSPAAVGEGAVVVDILRSSEETGDPEATARLGDQEVWMCPDGWIVVNPDGTQENRIFDCGQTEVFQAPVGTPIEVTGDFETVNVTTRMEGDRVPGSSDVVPSLEAGSILTLSYEVTWTDGSEASFWLQLTVQGGDGATLDPEEIVVRIEGLGRSEATRRWPVMTVSFRGETYRGCTEGFEWTTADGSRIDEVAGRSGSVLPQCSYDPLFVVPPRTPIVVLAESGTEVFVTRTTTPLYTGVDGVGVSVSWPDGDADFLAYFDVRYDDPVPRNILLDCPPSDRVQFTTPDGPRILPGGSAYITGNLPGFIRGDVVEQMTREADSGPGGWEGIWQVTRDSAVIATVDFGDLSGLACRGSGIGGV